MHPHLEFSVIEQQVSQADWIKKDNEIKLKVKAQCLQCPQELILWLINIENSECLHENFIIRERGMYDLKLQEIPGTKNKKVELEIECPQHREIKQRCFISKGITETPNKYTPQTYHIKTHPSH